MSVHNLKSKHYYLPEPKKRPFFCYFRKKEPSIQYKIQNHPGILWNGITTDAENEVINVIYDAVDQEEVHTFMIELGCKPFV